MTSIFTKLDPHSYYLTGQPVVEHLELLASVHFDTKTLTAKAKLCFDAAGHVDLDTRDLTIVKVTTLLGGEIQFEVGSRDPVLGSPLSFLVPEDRCVWIHYATSPAASGLQWLSPEQTTAGNHPFVFSQGEEIHARSYVPCQDTPSIRFTYEATLSVPMELRGLMAAPEHCGRTVSGFFAEERWKMPYPIPAYLIAFAVGELVSHDLSERSRVWAEPEVIQKAAGEFADIPLIMEVGEEIAGRDYPWGRYDVLVMPPSFPYGGMENPCLSFVTPALITGDRSQVHVIAHEYAHSFTGNLVTNACWSDFWLNEGWTVWFEGRIVESVYGFEESMIGRAFLAREHERDVKRFAASRPLFASLKPDLNGTNPDDAFSRVPYFRGSEFLRMIEGHVGRDMFDEFVGDYLDHFAFKSITTAQFLDFVEARLPGVLGAVGVWNWVYEASMPGNALDISAPGITVVEEYARKSEVPPVHGGRHGGSGWKSSRWALYLELLPRPASREVVEELEQRFRLAHSLNTDVRWAYLLLAVESGFTDVYGEVEEFLLQQGRMKYLNPLYQALAKTPHGRAFAEHIFAKARSRYHPIAVSQVERVLREARAT